MADEDEDIFGKIDALLEKRAGFGRPQTPPSADDDFPVLTEVVASGQGDAAPRDRRQADRRLGLDRRQDERAKPAPGRLDMPRAALSEAQFERLLARLEHKLEDLFIRQQFRLEEAVRRALRGQGDKPGAETTDRP